MRFAPGMVRSLLLGLGAVAILFVSGRFIGTREMLFEMAHDPAGLDSERWSAEDFGRLWMETSPAGEVGSDEWMESVRGRAEAPEAQPRQRYSLVWSLLLIVISLLVGGLLLLVSIGTLGFLFAPLLRKRGTRWRSPRMNRLRWALIGAACAVVVFAVPEAHHMTRLSLEVQAAGVWSPPPAVPDTYWDSYWSKLWLESSPLFDVAAFGLCVVAIGLWAAGRRRSRAGLAGNGLDVVLLSRDGLLWALTGALWMAICVAALEAYSRWVAYPLVAKLMPIPGPDGTLPVSDLMEGLPGLLVLGSPLPALTIVAFGIAVFAAGWWISAGWRSAATEQRAEERTMARWTTLLAGILCVLLVAGGAALVASCSGGGAPREVGDAAALPLPAPDEPPPQSQVGEREDGVAPLGTTAPDSDEQERRRPPFEMPDWSGGEMAVMVVGVLLVPAGFLVLAIGIFVFLFAPLFRRIGKRWVTPTMSRFRWAFIGATCTAIGFTAYKAYDLAHFSIYMQRYGLSRREGPVRAFPEAFWGFFTFQLPSLLIVVVSGLILAIVGSWAVGRWRSRRGSSDEPAAAPRNRTTHRLCWTLIGALWMAICFAVREATGLWVAMQIELPLMEGFMSEQGPDGIPQSSEPGLGFMTTYALVKTVPKVLIAAVGIGVIAAGWWAIQRWRMKRAQMTTP